MNSNGNSHAKFCMAEFVRNWERFRLGHGLFIAGFDPEYNAVWLRDNMYAVLAYFYRGERHNAWWTMRQIVNTLKWEVGNLQTFHTNSQLHTDDILGALEPFPVKWTSDLFHYKNWGHHQMDAIGLFLHTLGFLDAQGVQVIDRKNQGDLEFVQHAVYFVAAARYGLKPDLGAWEECRLLRTSSVGPVLAGLRFIQQQGLAHVPEHLFGDGESALTYHLPYESKDVCSRHPAFSHCCDVSQLSLIWPLNVVSQSMARQIVGRLVDGHVHEGVMLHQLAGQRGFRRYPNDEFWRSAEGIQAEWPMFFFHLSIIHSFWGEYNWAEYWFTRGAEQLRDNWAYELFQAGGEPNRVLNWSFSMAIIAYECLSSELKAQCKFF